MTRIHDSPSVSGTNRKWYIAVAANCSRDTLTRSRSGSTHCSFRGCRGVRRINSLCHALGADVPTQRTREPDAPDHEERDDLHYEHDRDLERIPGTGAAQAHIMRSPRPQGLVCGACRRTSSSAARVLRSPPPRCLDADATFPRST